LSVAAKKGTSLAVEREPCVKTNHLASETAFP